VVLFEPVHSEVGQVEEIDSTIVVGVSGQPHEIRLIPAVLAGIGVQDDPDGVGIGQLAVGCLKLQRIGAKFFQCDRGIRRLRIADLSEISLIWLGSYRPEERRRLIIGNDPQKLDDLPIAFNPGFNIGEMKKWPLKSRLA
jgi:hypothetical protein